MAIAANNKISIIVPIYNAEKFLNVLFESVLNQTSPLWEMICIDDGSVDRSGEIAENWAKKDNRIRVIHQINQGVSAARNRGLDEANTSLITFVDADDYLDCTFIQKILSVYENNVCDAVFCGHASHSAAGIKESFPTSQGGLHLISYEFLRNDFPFPWAKVFKREIIQSNRIRFTEGMPVGEDTLFCYHYFIQAESIFAIQEPLYHYHEGEGAWQKFLNGNYQLQHYEQLLDIVGKTMDKILGLPRHKRKTWWLELHRQTIRLMSMLNHCKIDSRFRKKLLWKGMKLLFYIDFHLSPLKLVFSVRRYLTMRFF